MNDPLIDQIRTGVDGNSDLVGSANGLSTQTTAPSRGGCTSWALFGYDVRKNCDICTPPPCHCPTQSPFSTIICFWANPLPPQCRCHMWIAPRVGGVDRLACGRRPSLINGLMCPLKSKWSFFTDSLIVHPNSSNPSHSPISFYDWPRDTSWEKAAALPKGAACIWCPHNIEII